MFKKYYLVVFLLTGALTLNAQIETPQPSPFSKVEQVVGLTDVSVEYSRPSMKGRKIFGNLVSHDKKWRTGANKNTIVTFGDDVTIDGKSLKAGSYALFTVPNKKSWDFIFYSDTNNWGTPRKWDDAKVALKTSAKPMKLPMKVETFTITFDDLTDKSAMIGLIWENVYVGVTFEVPTDTKASASIDKVMAGPSANDYFNAAGFYRKSSKDLDKALIWINKAVELRPKAFWMVKEKSIIQAALGNKKEAIATAKASMALAEKAGNDNYVKMNKDNIAKWSK